MTGLNLHNMVKQAISAVHPEEVVTLYLSLGQVNNKGKITPIYLAPQVVKAQVQAESDATLYHANKVGESELIRRIWLDANSLLPPQGLVRQKKRGGDIVQRADGTFWLATGVPDDFSAMSGWVSIRCSLQTIKPDFSASPWYQP